MNANLTIVEPRSQVNRLSRRQRDFLMLLVFLLLRSGYAERAGVLLDAMHAAGDRARELHVARAVLLFEAKDWQGVLELLDWLDQADPDEHNAPLHRNDRPMIQRYLRARCLYELGRSGMARNAVDDYLKHCQRISPG